MKVEETQMKWIWVLVVVVAMAEACPLHPKLSARLVHDEIIVVEFWGAPGVVYSLERKVGTNWLQADFVEEKWFCWPVIMSAPATRGSDIFKVIGWELE